MPIDMAVSAWLIRFDLIRFKCHPNLTTQLRTLKMGKPESEEIIGALLIGTDF